eukprot:1185331-Rhodomonas_salina.1
MAWSSTMPPLSTGRGVALCPSSAADHIPYSLAFHPGYSLARDGRKVRTESSILGYRRVSTGSSISR